jgi:hypothetical protein
MSDIEEGPAPHPLDVPFVNPELHAEERVGVQYCKTAIGEHDTASLADAGGEHLILAAGRQPFLPRKKSSYYQSYEKTGGNRSKRDTPRALPP